MQRPYVSKSRQPTCPVRASYNYSYCYLYVYPRAKTPPVSASARLHQFRRSTGKVLSELACVQSR